MLYLALENRHDLLAPAIPIMGAIVHATGQARVLVSLSPSCSPPSLVANVANAAMRTLRPS